MRSNAVRRRSCDVEEEEEGPRKDDRVQRIEPEAAEDANDAKSCGNPRSGAARAARNDRGSGFPAVMTTIAF